MIFNRDSFGKTLKRASKGHRKIQVVIYEDYYGYAMNVALRFCDSREEAQEVVHDSFIKVFAKLRTVENAESFKSWLRRIVVNTSIDLFRKRKTAMGELDITRADGTLTVTKAALTATADDASKVYGEPNSSFDLLIRVLSIVKI